MLQRGLSSGRSHTDMGYPVLKRRLSSPILRTHRFEGQMIWDVPLPRCVVPRELLHPVGNSIALLGHPTLRKRGFYPENRGF
jgi:hypothetical protein